MTVAPPFYNAYDKKSCKLCKEKKERDNRLTISRNDESF
jgi:hypothetical protein